MGSGYFYLHHPKAAISVGILHFHPLDKRRNRKAKIMCALGAGMDLPGQKVLGRDSSKGHSSSH